MIKNIKDIKNIKIDMFLRVAITTLLLFVASRLLFVFVATVWNYLWDNTSGFFHHFYRWDAEWYMVIIEKGYISMPIAHTEGDAGNYVFYPFYPLCVRLFKLLTFNIFSTNTAGCIFSNICIYFASILSVFYYKQTRGVLSYLPAVIFFFFPYTFFFSCMYTEALYVLLVMGVMILSKNRQYFLAGILSACASATRIVGVFLIVIILLNMYFNEHDEISIEGIKQFVVDIIKTPKHIISLIICPMGTFAYMYYLYNLTGDAWANKHGMVAWRSETFGNPLKSILVALSGQIGVSRQFSACICLIGLFFAIYLIKEKRLEEGIFLLISLLLPISSSVGSTERYLIGTAVFELAIADFMLKHEKTNSCVISVMIIIEMVLTYCWFSLASFLI